MKTFSQEKVDQIHKALDEIMAHADALYNLANEGDKPGALGVEHRGWSPAHDLNSSVGLIRNALTLAGFERTPLCG